MRKRIIVGVGIASFILIVILLVSIFLLIGLIKIPGKEKAMCSANEGCVKVQTSCCPCSAGGEEKCVPKSEEAGIRASLEKCGEDIVCPQVYKCAIKTCECEDGKCSATSLYQ